MSDTKHSTDRTKNKPEDTPQNKNTSSGTDKQYNTLMKSNHENSVNGSRHILSSVIIFVSICALVTSVYIVWRIKSFEQAQSLLFDGMDQLQTQMAQQQVKLSDLSQNTKTDIETQKAQLQNLQQQEDHFMLHINSLSNKIRVLEGQSRDRLRLDEVEYLLRMANQQLLTVNDTRRALKLMTGAEQILEAANDYTTLPLRKALAEDISVLMATPVLDKEKIWFRLQSIVDLIPSLEIFDGRHRGDSIALVSKSEVIDSAQNTELLNRTWKQNIQDFLLDTWNRFVGLFRINTQRERSIDVLPTEEESQLIRQKMFLLLEQSKLALIHEQQPIYLSSLQQFADYLNRYFILDNEESSQITNELEDLLKLFITPQKNSITRSLEALKTHQNQILSTPNLEPVIQSSPLKKTNEPTLKKRKDSQKDSSDTEQHQSPEQKQEQEQEQGVEIS